MKKVRKHTVKNLINVDRLQYKSKKIKLIDLYIMKN